MCYSNLGNLVEEFWDKEEKATKLNPEDEIIRGCLITKNGEICNEQLKEMYGS